MKKPKPHTKEYYVYHDVRDYVVKKYKMKKEASAHWDYLIESVGIANGGSFNFYLGDYEDEFEKWPDLSEGYIEYVRKIAEEFGESIEFEVYW